MTHYFEYWRFVLEQFEDYDITYSNKHNLPYREVLVFYKNSSIDFCYIDSNAELKKSFYGLLVYM